MLATTPQILTQAYHGGALTSYRSNRRYNGHRVSSPMSHPTVPPSLPLLFKSLAVIAVPLILAYAEFDRSLTEIPRGIAAIVCLGLLLFAWLALRNSLASRWWVYFLALLSMLALATAWFGLNQLRVHWYDQGVVRGFWGYRYAVEAQYVLVWPFLVLLVVSTAVAIYELLRWIARRIFKLKQV